MFLIQDMHYDFKQKLNKIDSQKYRNLRIQEIDWKLNEGLEVFIKTIAEPRYSNSGLGVESNERIIDDLRSVVVEKYQATVTVFDNKSYRIQLPDDYWFLLNADADGTKGTCSGRNLKCIQRIHDEQPEDSPFDISSFEWEEVNYRYYKDGIRFFTDGTFTIDHVYLDYILKPPYMHFAAGVQGGSYNLPSGVTLTGTQDCVFSSSNSICREIVDIAVLITTGDLQMSDYQVKAAKLKMND